MTTYLNKKFCKNGHFAYRYKSNRSCVECRLATSELRSAYRLAKRMDKTYTSETRCKNGQCQKGTKVTAHVLNVVKIKGRKPHVETNDINNTKDFCTTVC